MVSVCAGVTTTRPSTAWQPPSPSTQRCERSTLQLPPLPVSTLSHLVKVVPPFSPSPSSRAALCTKGILHSAAVWKTPGAGLFCKVIYIVLLRCIVSQMQLKNINPPTCKVDEIFLRTSLWSLRYCVWLRERLCLWMSTCEWTAVREWLVPLPYCNSNDLQFIFTLKCQQLCLHR